MTRVSHCGGCAPRAANSECRDSFARIGVLKAHWECWSDCNLPCSFCYRTRGHPLDTDEAKRLLTALSTAGIEQVVFAGGDPSIRPDIVELIDYSRSVDLRIEVQTNAHTVSPRFLQALETVDLVGLSLDGPDAYSHDSFRGKPGNFDRVMNLLGELNEKGMPMIVRTIVSKRNASGIPRIALLLAGLRSVVRWSLLEFSPIGEGATSRNDYLLGHSSFESIAKEAEQLFKGPAAIDIYRADAQAGTYALITPSGYLYGTTKSTANVFFPTVGSLLDDHLAILAERLPFSKDKHTRRYESLIPS